jgi:hypothetical protein
VIDLHLHTRASDGAHEPDELVRRVWLAGIQTFSVTDHDTVAGVAEASDAARRYGIACVTGIEITAVLDGVDLHVLGYFIDPASTALQAFLAAQRTDRIRRARELAARLGRLGMPIDVDALIAATPDERSIGRPHMAAALVRAGHVPTSRDAFDHWIGEGRPAFVPRAGADPAAVVRLIHDAGGLACLAHPGATHREDAVDLLTAAGVDALEVYHPDHDEEMTRRYRAIAADRALLVTGGSDYHREDGHHASALGRVTLPQADFDRLVAGRR